MTLPRCCIYSLHEIADVLQQLSAATVHERFGELFLLRASLAPAPSTSARPTTREALPCDPWESPTENMGPGEERLGLSVVALHFGVPRAALCLGRDPLGDVVIDDDTVSWRHALIAREPGAITVLDLGSSNGTVVDDRPIPPHGARQAFVGSSLELGGVLCSLVDAAGLKALAEVVLRPYAKVIAL